MVKSIKNVGAALNRQYFSKEFKLEAVRLLELGLCIADAARNWGEFQQTVSQVGRYLGYSAYMHMAPTVLR